MLPQDFDPEAYGRLTAEALVGGLEALKRSVTADATPGDLGAQLDAGQAAVDAMKRVLGSLVDQARSLDR